MKIKLINMGGSKWLRLPNVFVDQCNFNDAVDVCIKDGKFIISGYNNPREGWDSAFKSMAKTGDDELLHPEVFGLKSDDSDWFW